MGSVRGWRALMAIARVKVVRCGSTPQEVEKQKACGFDTCGVSQIPGTYLTEFRLQVAPYGPHTVRYPPCVGACRRYLTSVRTAKSFIWTGVGHATPPGAHREIMGQWGTLSLCGTPRSKAERAEARDRPHPLVTSLQIATA